MIQINNISKAYGEKTVLDNISFTFETGKTNMIIGESGSGKTTLLKCMVGLTKPDNGEVLLSNMVRINGSKSVFKVELNDLSFARSP